MQRANPGGALRFRKADETGPAKPVLPTLKETAILRRASAGYVLVTNTEHGPEFCYDGGTPIEADGRSCARSINRLIREGWLIPDRDDGGLFGDAPQVYRTLKPGGKAVS
jgi:hypothetical protein